MRDGFIQLQKSSKTLSIDSIDSSTYLLTRVSGNREAHLFPKRWMKYLLPSPCVTQRLSSIAMACCVYA